MADSGSLGRGELRLQLLLLGLDRAEGVDHLVQEVVDLVLVISLTELGRLEPLVDYIFRS